LRIVSVAFEFCDQLSLSGDVPLAFGYVPLGLSQEFFSHC